MRAALLLLAIAGALAPDPVSAQAPDGYEVRYRLGDQEGTVRTDRAPGGSIPVENGQLVLTGLNDPK